jgi:hypothetical protein
MYIIRCRMPIQIIVKAKTRREVRGRVVKTICPWLLGLELRQGIRILSCEKTVLLG